MRQLPPAFIDAFEAVLLVLSRCSDALPPLNLYSSSNQPLIIV